MSGKRYYSQDPESRGWYTLLSGARVHVYGDALSVQPECADYPPFGLSLEDAIGLGMIAQQAPGYVVTRSDASPRLRGGALRGGEQ